MRRFKMVIFVLVLIFLAAGMCRAMDQMMLAQDPMVGKAAKDFTPETTARGKANFSEDRAGQKAVIFFWATWCPHCRSALGEVSQKAKDLTAKGIQVFLVDIDEEKDYVKNFLAKNKISFEVFLDSDSEVAESYGVVGIPSFIFVDEQGVVKSVKHMLPQDTESLF